VIGPFTNSAINGFMNKMGFKLMFIFQNLHFSLLFIADPMEEQNVIRAFLKTKALRRWSDLLSRWIIEVKGKTDSIERCNRISYLYGRWVEVIDVSIVAANSGEAAAFFERDMKDLFVEFFCTPHRNELLEFINTDVVKTDDSLSQFSEFIMENFVTPRSLGGLCAGLIKHLVDKDNIAYLPLSDDVKNSYFT
jgi:hypothetical protein